MEYIADELKRNGVNINKEVFKEQMSRMKKEYGARYEDMMKRAEPEDLTDIFHSMNMNSDGRILSYLLLLYYEKQRGVDIAEPLRLVANVMKLKLEKKSRKTLFGIIPCMLIEILLLYYSL